METPNVTNGTAQSTGFSKVYVSGEKMTFSGGPHNRMQTQVISIHRCVASLLPPTKIEISIYLINIVKVNSACNRENQGQTIHSTEIFISMNLLHMSCVITWAL